MTDAITIEMPDNHFVPGAKVAITYEPERGALLLTQRLPNGDATRLAVAAEDLLEGVTDAVLGVPIRLADVLLVTKEGGGWALGRRQDLRRPRRRAPQHHQDRARRTGVGSCCPGRAGGGRPRGELDPRSAAPDPPPALRTGPHQRDHRRWPSRVDDCGGGVMTGWWSARRLLLAGVMVASVFTGVCFWFATSGDESATTTIATLLTLPGCAVLYWCTYRYSNLVYDYPADADPVRRSSDAPPVEPGRPLRIETADQCWEWMERGDSSIYLVQIDGIGSPVLVWMDDGGCWQGTRPVDEDDGTWDQLPEVTRQTLAVRVDFLEQFMATEDPGALVPFTVLWPLSDALTDPGPACRICGCTEDAACPGGCAWAPDDGRNPICTACALADRAYLTGTASRHLARHEPPEYTPTIADMRARHAAGWRASGRAESPEIDAQFDRFIQAQTSSAAAAAVGRANELHVTEMVQLVLDRDRVEAFADRLAAAIAPAEVLGEHSSANNPWLNALDYAEAQSVAVPTERRGRAAALDIADGIEGALHQLDCETCPEQLARIADQWRTEAQAEAEPAAEGAAAPSVTAEQAQAAGTWLAEAWGQSLNGRHNHVWTHAHEIIRGLLPKLGIEVTP